MSNLDDAATAPAEDIQTRLEAIPDDKLIEAAIERIHNQPPASQLSVLAAKHSFSGPLPPPNMLAEYDTVHEGLANRIVSMAESEQQHRHQMENQSLRAAVTAESRGQHYALIISLIIIGGALYLIDNGKEIYGSILAGGTLTALAYMFITGKHKDATADKENQE
jgi:uncharacterized membrane protein